MRGIPKFNFPLFFQVAERLRKAGYVVFNPAERDVQEYGPDIASSPTGNLKTAEKKGFSLRRALAKDTNYICRVANAIVLLPGWEKSKGATAERALGEALGLDIFEWEDIKDTL